MGVSHLYILVVLVIYALIPLILDGVERKLRAALQSRIGPPITQTLYDLLKLALVKETKITPTTLYATFTLISAVTTSLASLYYTVIYIISGDLSSIFYAIALLATSTTAHTITPLLVPNPYSIIGGMREVVLAIVNEAALVLSISLYATIVERLIAGGSSPVLLVATALVVVVALISSYVASGRVPFDIAEAEPELASGVLIEFSGRVLALNIYSLLLRRLATKLLVLAPTLALISGHGAGALILSLLALPALWTVYATVAVVLGRSRVDLAPLTLAKIYMVLITIYITVLLVVTRA